MHKLPTQDRLKELFHYDPLTGDVTRLVTVNNWAMKGAVLRTKQACRTNTYYSVRVDTVSYKVHRLIWMYMTGEDPDYIDHIDGCGTNNKWVNLRSVTPADNSRNMPLYSSNKSGIAGVCWKTKDKAWVASVGVKQKTIYLGGYRNIFDAAAAVISARAKLGFHKNHGRH